MARPVQPDAIQEMQPLLFDGFIRRAIKVRNKVAVFMLVLTASIVYFTYYAFYRNSVLTSGHLNKDSIISDVCISEVLIGSSYVLTVFGGCLGDALVTLYIVVCAGLVTQTFGAVMLLTAGCLYDSVQINSLFYTSLAFEALSVTLIQAALPVLGAEQVKHAGNSAVHLYFQVYYWFNNVGSFFAEIVGYIIFKTNAGTLKTLGIVEVVVTLTCLPIFILGKCVYIIPKKNPKKLVELFKERPTGLLMHLWHVSLVFSFISVASMLHSQIDTIFQLQGTVMSTRVNGIDLPEKLSTITNDVFILIGLPIYWIFRCVSKRHHTIDARRAMFTPLQRFGFAMLLLIVAVTLSGILEFVRFQSAEPISILWQIPQYVLQAIAELFIFLPAYFFAFTESPKGLHGFVNGMYLCARGIGTYSSALVIYIMRNTYVPKTDVHWYPADLKNGHFGYSMFLMAGMGTLALFVFMIFSPRYLYAKDRRFLLDGLENLDHNVL